METGGGKPNQTQQEDAMVCAASKHMGGAGSQVEVADTMKRKLPETRTSIS